MYKKINTVLCLVDVAIMLVTLQTGQYLAGAVLLFISSFIRLICKLSNGSFLLELVYVHAALTCLLMPAIGYEYFNAQNRLARIWVKYMTVPEETYFVFVIPSIVCLGLAFFFWRYRSTDDHTVINPLVADLKKSVQTIPAKSIVVLASASLFAYAISKFLPAGFQQINAFLYYSFYTSIFYVYYYRNFPYRKVFLILGVLFILYDALQSGMFTIIAYMSGIFMILLLAGRKINFGKRLLFISLAFVFLIFVQLFKLNLRQSRQQGSADLTDVLERTVLKANSDNQFESILFPIYIRMNQGFNIALVQRRIPKYSAYLKGDYLALTFASAFVPRLFWPDKPTAGGQHNMKVYTGITIRRWSTNVGPFGEAYGNFGNSGWIYVIGFGLFIRFAYARFLKICKRRPIFFIWMPVLFFQVVYVMETDSLQAFNSLIKGAIFIFIFYKLFPAFFPKKSHENSAGVQKA